MRWQTILGVATATAGVVAFTGCSEEPLEPRPMPGSVLEKAAPAISGGTLLNVGANRIAASDPDTDQIHLVSLGASHVESVDLELGDEPGRLALGQGKVFAALRGGGALASIDLESHTVKRLEVCSAPRGLAVEGDVVHVACAGGELVTVDRELEGVVRSLDLERDLRDVVVLPDGNLAVTVFRAADLLIVNATGAVLNRFGATSTELDRAFTPAVAWRAIPSAGTIVMLHQRGVVNDVPIDPEPSAPPDSSPYGGGSSGGFGCENSIVHAGITVFDPTFGPHNVGPGGVTLGPIVLPVDIALTVDGQRYAVAGAGSNVVVSGFRQDFDLAGFPLFECPSVHGIRVPGEPIAVAFGDQGQLIVQRRNPAGLVVLNGSGETTATIDFGGPSRRQVGHLVFHQAASPTSAIACASCHPEGRDDGLVWTFEDLGPRRTQNLTGGILDTMPLHWDGDLGDLDDLMGEVFVERMGGSAPSEAQVDELASWIQTIPRLPAKIADGDAVARGEALFHDDVVGCADCHSGKKFTNHATMAVGTGKPFQVPSLVGIADRAPFMHDGCAATLADRFDPYCGGGDLHGVTSHLTATQIGDLVAYLESL